MNKNDVKKYFEKNKKEIDKTIEYISKRQNEDINTTRLRIYNEFKNLDLINDKQIIVVDNVELSIEEILKNFRNRKTEIFSIYILNENNLFKIFEKLGNEHSASPNEIETFNLFQKLLLYKKPYFVIHNHPYLFKATFSESDFISFEQFISFSLETHIQLLDFSIVTDFDYWSGVNYLKNNGVIKNDFNIK